MPDILTKEQRRKNMQHIGSRDTKIEVILRKGAWWIMLQTAESICNYASRRDPINNAYLSEFWLETNDEIKDILKSGEDRPFPYDDLMQMISFCGDQLTAIVSDPRHNIVKVDKMVRPYRVHNTGSKTMNWLGSGKNTLLKNVIDFFMDYEIKSDNSITEEKQKEQIQMRRDEFSSTAQDLITKLQTRLKRGNKEILSYADEIGASFDKAEPSFEGKITESEIYSILQLIVKQETGMTIPISHNGLGYNNLIFMSLLLAKMQVDSDGKYLGSNAKVFPILAIEEPEAHLHPTMQYQFVKFLKTNIKSKKVKQVFITSHSTHISAATTLDDIICFYKNNGNIQVAYPGKAFTSKEDNGNKIVQNKSKKYVQRFFDATKSNMLFAEKIILVEGIAEQLLLPVFAEYLTKSLEESHVAVINVGGRYFEHFLYLFDSNNEYTINRKVACITDLDPARRKKSNNENQNKYKICYPYEYNSNTDEFEYLYNELMNKYEKGKHENIVSFVQPKKYGKTLEYQLVLENPLSRIMITESIANSKELKELMDLFENNEPLPKLMKRLSSSNENTRIIESVKSVDESWSEEDKKKALMASRYLNSVGKGENALELASALKDNLELRGKDGYQKFVVPQYIADAIEWVCD